MKSARVILSDEFRYIKDGYDLNSIAVAASI